MKCFWCGLVVDLGVANDFIDNWISGYVGEDHQSIVFAVKAESEDVVRSFIKEHFKGNPEERFVSEVEWNVYGDFAGSREKGKGSGRWPMASKFLADEIDNIEKCVARIK